MSRPFLDGSDNLFGWERVIDDCQLKGNLYPDTDKLICMCTTVTYSRAQPPVTADLHYWAWIYECFFLPSYVWMKITISLKHWNNGKNNFTTDFFFWYWSLLISAIQYTILTILNKEWHCKTKIKGKDKIQLVYRMLQLLITKNEYVI